MMLWNQWGHKLTVGNNFTISIEAESKEEADKLFNGIILRRENTNDNAGWLIGDLILACLQINSEFNGW